MPKQINKSIKFGFILLISIILTLGFSVSLQSLLASWTAPSDNPPSSNFGDLLIGGSLGVGVNVGIGGKVGIGTAITATSKTTMKASNNEEGLRIISSNYSPLIIRNTADAGDLFRVDQSGSLVAGIIPWARVSGAPAETDPQVGTLNTSGNQWCKSDAGGVVQCNNASPTIAETDPQVGTLTNGKWCTSNGTSVNCTSDAPSVVPKGTTAGWCFWGSSPWLGSACTPSTVKAPATCTGGSGSICGCQTGWTSIETGRNDPIATAAWYSCIKN